MEGVIPVASGNSFEELLTHFTVKMAYMRSLMILVCIMDILSQKYANL
jgi:hypothetical protein